MSCYWKTYRGEYKINRCFDGYVTIKEHTYSVVGNADEQCLQKAFRMIAPIADKLDKLRCLTKIGIERGKPTVWISGKVEVKLSKINDNQIYMYMFEPRISLLRLESRVLEQGIVNGSNLLTIINQLTK